MALHTLNLFKKYRLYANFQNWYCLALKFVLLIDSGFLIFLWKYVKSLGIVTLEPLEANMQHQSHSPTLLEKVAKNQTGLCNAKKYPLWYHSYQGKGETLFHPEDITN